MLDSPAVRSASEAGPNTAEAGAAKGTAGRIDAALGTQRGQADCTLLHRTVQVLHRLEAAELRSQDCSRLAAGSLPARIRPAVDIEVGACQLQDSRYLHRHSGGVHGAYWRRGSRSCLDLGLER